jgi:hypothetical protein
LDRSLAFCVGVVGFAVVLDRPDERFVSLALEGVQMMLEEADGPGRRFRMAPLEHPFGLRGLGRAATAGSMPSGHAVHGGPTEVRGEPRSLFHRPRRAKIIFFSEHLRGNFVCSVFGLLGSRRAPPARRNCRRPGRNRRRVSELAMFAA